MSSSIRWPAERFYWSVLDAPGWRRSGQIPAGLRPAFEEDVPLPGDELHAVCAPIGNDRLIICAARRDDLAALDPGILILAPETLPAGVEAQFDPATLNLLVGDFEPRTIRRVRHRRHLASALALTLSCVLLAIGLERRAEYHYGLAREAQQARTMLIAQVGPGATADGVKTELATLRRSSEIGQRVRPPEDVSLALVELLQGWPADVNAQPQTLAVSGTSIAMSVLLEGDPGQFLEALRAPSGWVLEQPRLNKVDRMMRLDLRFRTIAEGGRP